MFTQDPSQVVAELRTAAGVHTEILAREIGTWVGFYDSDKNTHTLAAALLEAFPEARPHVGIGQARRMRPIHGTG